jgi:hemerythrin-like domain-containing protein
MENIEKITQALTTEHVVFRTVFDQIDQLLPNLTAVGEVKLLARLVEGLLHRHGEIERNLAYLALDHVLQERGQLDRLHQEHQEIDARLKRVQGASDVPQAQRLLRSALAASREHFRQEERTVFPFMEEVLSVETLARLGTAWQEAGAASP